MYNLFSRCAQCVIFVFTACFPRLQTIISSFLSIFLRSFSATGGADSRNVSEKGTPTEEGQPGMVGNGKNEVFHIHIKILFYILFMK